MSYKINIEAWSEIAGTRIKTLTAVEHVADDKPPEQQVYEKILDLTEQSMTQALESLGWASPETVAASVATMETASRALDASNTIAQRRLNLLRQAFPRLVAGSTLWQAIQAEVGPV